MAVALDPVEQLREQIETTAARGDITDGERAAMFRLLRDRLTGLLGLLGRYMHDEERAQESARLSGWLTEEEARSRANFRQEMLDRSIATEQELDELGYFSHAELDKLAEEGLLEESLMDFARKAMSGSLFERIHPRGRGGQWIDKPGGGSLLKTNLKSTGPPPEPLRPSRPRAKPVRTEGTTAKPQPAGFQERVGKLEAKTKEHVTLGRHNFTPAEAHFNDAGKVSQHTLARYVDQAATQPTTIDRYSQLNADGTRVWDESRRELHEQIINRFLRQRVFDPEAKGGKGDWVFSDDAPELVGSDEPSVLFSGGGYAAGKGTVLKLIRARGDEPDSGYEGPTLTLDPDQVKAMLPEYQDALDESTGGGVDPEGNMLVYQEAWAIAQEIQARAQERKLNIIVDGISDTSPEEMTDRVKGFHDKGYKARAVYVNIPTEEAMSRAANRARNAKDSSDLRHIPEIIMRSVHRDVSATVPNLIRRLQEDGIPLDVEVWDNNQGKDEQGNFRPPLRFFSYENGKETIENADLWRAFVDKAHESIIGVD